MITVQEAEHIIAQQVRAYGTTHVPLVQAHGRVLAGAVAADRDLPPYDRVTMDGIAFAYNCFAAGQRIFPVSATVAAGAPAGIVPIGSCVEIMTGAALPAGADTVIRYEDVLLEAGQATVSTEAVKIGQNIHVRGSDTLAGSQVLQAGRLITPAVISMAASVGMATLPVLTLPRVAIISSGDELVDVHQVPGPFQVRRSNACAMQAILQPFGIQPQLLHIPDDPVAMHHQLNSCMDDYDVLLLSGGVSMGKYDHVPAVLTELGVMNLFHKVKQRPGKPFWFGARPGGVVVFAFPGNPLSAFMCMYRYFRPWLQAILGQQPVPAYAILDEVVHFAPDLQLFHLVRVYTLPDGRTMASPVVNNSSGDFTSLLQANAFIELPAGQHVYPAGGAYRIWRY